MFSSVKEARQADHISAHLYEIAPHQAEAKTARYSEGEGVQLWPWRTFA